MDFKKYFQKQLYFPETPQSGYHWNESIDEEYLWRTFPDVHKFWAARDYLGLTHWGNGADLSIHR